MFGVRGKPSHRHPPVERLAVARTVIGMAPHQRAVSNGATAEVEDMHHKTGALQALIARAVMIAASRIMTTDRPLHRP